MLEKIFDGAWEGADAALGLMPCCPQAAIKVLMYRVTGRKSSFNYLFTVAKVTLIE